jgi:hypothetical protein
MSLFGFASAEASAVDRVTRGDAQAIFQTSGNAGRTLRDDPSVPSDAELLATIRAFSGTVFDGRHYCAEDWHVILVTANERGDRSFSIQDAKELLDPLTFGFILDGNVLPTERTSIKSFHEPGSFEKAFYFNQGVVLSPSALTVGSHTLVETGAGGTVTDQITFHIDAPGTGACL